MSQPDPAVLSLEHAFLLGVSDSSLYWNVSTGSNVLSQKKKN